MNPPFDPGFVERLVAHLESVLSRSATRKTDGDDDDDDDDDDDAEALSFVVVVPYWPEKRAWLRLVNSEFARKVLKLRAGAHGFVAGAQHLRPDKVVPSAAATSVVFLQNDAGAKRWPVTSEKIDAVNEGFRGGLKARDDGGGDDSESDADDVEKANRRAAAREARTDAAAVKWDPDASLFYGVGSVARWGDGGA